MIDISKYKFYSDEKARVVVALSTFAKKPVRGKAKCDPRDEFSTSDGMLLAAARCNERIAEKRKRNAEARYVEAVRKAQEANEHLEKMKKYFDDSIVRLEQAKADLEEIDSSYRGE
jgi:hypothetical protein